MKKVIMNSRHVHLAGTGTIRVIVDLLSDSEYTIYTKEELLDELHARLPKQNICVYQGNLSDDAKDRKLVLLSVHDAESLKSIHMLEDKHIKYWTFSSNWVKGQVVPTVDFMKESFVIVHCSEGNILGTTHYSGKV